MLWVARTRPEGGTPAIERLMTRHRTTRGDAVNIFESIRRVTKRTEPFHSRFLADALVDSIGGDRSLFKAVWRMATPEGWKVPEQAKVGAEDVVEQGRIDISIKSDEPARRVLGIEVKTTDSSTTQGQLERYLEGLRETYDGYEVAIAYLTPFNRERGADRAQSLPTVREFDDFCKVHPTSRHVSWLDIAAIPWNGNELWRQHQSYVRQHISSQKKLDITATRDRSLDRFFGGECVDAFWEALGDLGIASEDGGAVIELADRAPDSADRLAESLLILATDGEGVAHNANRRDKISVDLRRQFLESPHCEIHKALFALSCHHGHVWLQGKRDYAVRVAHERYPGGVSLVRSDTPDRLKIVGQR